MPMTRFYAAPGDAATAIAELKAIGFGENRVQSVAKTGEHVSVDGIIRRGIAPSRARGYAARIREGETLVIVDAPPGYAARAAAILDRAHAGEAEAPASNYEGTVWEEATPLSSALGIPVLLNNPAPLSSFWNIPTLSRRQGPKRRSFGLPLLYGNPAPLSSAVGLAVLSQNPAPLSSAIGMKTLSGNPAPLSSAIGMAVLSKNPAPLSSAIGMPTLSRNPAPLSAALSAPVLAEEDPK